jgi:hypothetical protein
MIANVDPGKVLFFSVALDDGSMEAFEDIKDAVAHASECVERGGSQRGIYVAVPRAKVHMGIRVDPLDPPATPLPMPVSNNTPAPSKEAADWIKAQGLVTQSNSQDHRTRTDEPDEPTTAAA